MSAFAVDKITRRYMRLYQWRFGRPPRPKFPEPIWVRTLIGIAGGPAAAEHVLDVWFMSPDPWFEKYGYKFDACFGAINRLIYTGKLQPRGTPTQQRAIRAFAKLMGEPTLRLVRQSPPTMRKPS